MDLISLFAKYDWWSGTWVILSALLDWATLVVNPSGDVVPARLFRQHESAFASFPSARLQTPEQEQQWSRLINKFYEQIVERSHDYQTTFSAKNITRVHEYLSSVSLNDDVAKECLFPKNRIVAMIRNEHHVQEETEGQQIAEYLLHRTETEALSFLESLSVYWAASLPVEEVKALSAGSNLSHSRGYVLYMLAEQLE